MTKTHGFRLSEKNDSQKIPGTSLSVEAVCREGFQQAQGRNPAAWAPGSLKSKIPHCGIWFKNKTKKPKIPHCGIFSRKFRQSELLPNPANHRLWAIPTRNDSDCRNDSDSRIPLGVVERLLFGEEIPHREWNLGRG